MSPLHMFLEKNMILQWNFLERGLSFFYHIFGILDSFSNPCISETNHCHFLVIEVIPLLLKFSCPEQKTFEKLKNFVDSLYDYDYSGVNDEESSDEEVAIVIEIDLSKLVSYTDSSSEEEQEDPHFDVNFDEPSDLAIN